MTTLAEVASIAATELSRREGKLMLAEDCRCRVGRTCPPCTAVIVKRATDGFRADVKRILKEHGDER